MIQAFKNNIAVLVAGLVLAFAAIATAAVPVTTYAAAAPSGANPQQAVCKGADGLLIDSNVSATECATASGQTSDGLNALITKIINIFSVIVGVVAVIMIIWGGFRYITSGGDSNNVGAAKNTILYAIVGLIIVALAQVIVRFVLGSASGVAT